MSKDAATKLFEKLKVYKNYSNECIFFKYIFDENDISETSIEESKKTAGADDPTVFRPEYTHQIFGDEEIIFGYKNLRIDYYLTPALLDAYIGLGYKEKISAQRFDGIEPDDVYSSFTEFGCSPGFTRNLNVFRSEKLIRDLEFRPYGSKIYEYTKEVSAPNSANAKQSCNFEIYKVDSSFPEFESKKFLEYIDRIQTMLVYYIETSSFIDTEDPQWTFYFLYEKKKNNSSLSTKYDTRYATVGFISVYNYYAYPDKIRSRISQILTFPQYQNCGHGSELIESVYRDALDDKRVIDVTAESPSPEFVKIRDFVTTKMCLTLDIFKDKSKLKCGYSNEFMLEALKKLKLPKLQSRRCYEILRLAATNQNDTDEWRSYRLELKKRFYYPFLRRSKYARNAGAISNEEASDKPAANGKDSALPMTNGKSNGTSSLDGKFANRFQATNGQEEGTTIGFGSSSASNNTNGFGSTSIKFSSTVSEIKPKATNGKSVSFGAVQNGKKTSMNTSNSTTDTSNYSSDDENDKESRSSQANLFVSEQERKKYLEDQFQESVNDYGKVLKRLEDRHLLAF